jgi:hypothetical protein
MPGAQPSQTFFRLEVPTVAVERLSHFLFSPQQMNGNVHDNPPNDVLLQFRMEGISC